MDSDDCELWDMSQDRSITFCWRSRSRNFPLILYSYSPDGNSNVLPVAAAAAAAVVWKWRASQNTTSQFSPGWRHVVITVLHVRSTYLATYFVSQLAQVVVKAAHSTRWRYATFYNLIIISNFFFRQQSFVVYLPEPWLFTQFHGT